MSDCDLINDLYEGLAGGDGDKMASLYAGDAVFSDPVFGELSGTEAGAMWRMLCTRAKDLKVEHSKVWAEDGRGGAHWEAYYTFSATGRYVHNIIDAEFKFEDGKIVEHRDHFDFWRWSRQALGAPGLFLGWTPLIRNKVGSQARKGLRAFMDKA